MGVAAPITADAVITKAASQLGVHEEPANSNKTPYGAWYGANGVAWCAIFVSWVLHHAGFPLAITTPKGYAYCPYGVDYFKKQGAWADKTVRPKRGWIVFFDFPNDNVNRVSHTGIVEGVLADGRVATLEGNTNGAGSRTGGNVMRHNRSVAGGIVGYGIIDYVTAPAPTPTPTPPEDPDMSAQDIIDIKAALASIEQRLVNQPSNGMFVYGTGGNLNIVWLVPDDKDPKAEMLVQDFWTEGKWNTRVLQRGVRPGSAVGGVRAVPESKGTRSDVTVQLINGERWNIVFDATQPGDLPGGWHRDRIA